MPARHLHREMLCSAVAQYTWTAGTSAKRSYFAKDRKEESSRTPQPVVLGVHVSGPLPRE